MKNETWEWIKAIMIAVVLVVLIRSFLFTPIIVDGLSMYPTLKDNSYMIVNKLSYTVGKPERFDLVVFKAIDNKNYIKRVIGLPGDHIEYKNDQLYVNGKLVKEPFLDKFKSKKIQPLTFDFSLENEIGLRKVPEGKLFVLGDNRRRSLDSRKIGAIDMEHVIGEAKIVYWPVDEFKIIRNNE